MPIPPDQLATLRSFGYTEVESRFLYLVATHSGYFTVRQFLEFAHAKSGKRNAYLIEKLFSQGHATAQRYRRRSCVYHLHSRTLYDAIGRGDHRQWHTVHLFPVHRNAEPVGHHAPPHRVSSPGRQQLHRTVPPQLEGRRSLDGRVSQLGGSTHLADWLRPKILCGSVTSLGQSPNTARSAPHEQVCQIVKYFPRTEYGSHVGKEFRNSGSIS